MNKTKKINKHLIWLDLEMTGLNPDIDTIIQVAIIITNTDLEIIGEPMDTAIYQNDLVLDAMNAWNQEHHGKSGLIERCKNSDITMEIAEKEVLGLLKKYGAPQELLLCGNTISNDVLFLRKYMPTVNHYLHYRTIDVSTIKELVKRWYPKLPNFDKNNTHNALEDIQESIEELKYYQKNIFV